MKRHLLFQSLFATIFLAPDKGGETGGVTAPKTLTEANARIGDLEARALLAESGKVKAETDLATAKADAETTAAELATVKGQFESATNTARIAQDELATARVNFAAVAKERDEARVEVAKAGENVQRLEKLCGVHGTAQSAAVTAGTVPAAKSSIADWDAKIRAAKTPADRSAVTAAFEKAVAEKLVTA